MSDDRPYLSRAKRIELQQRRRRIVREMYNPGKNRAEKRRLEKLRRKSRNQKGK